MMMQKLIKGYKSRTGKYFRQPFFNFNTWKSSQKLMPNFALVKHLHIGYAHDLVPGCKVLSFLGVYFHKLPAAFLFFGKLFNYRTQYFAGATPRSPEVNHHRNLVTSFDDIFFKIHINRFPIDKK